MKKNHNHRKNAVNNSCIHQTIKQIEIKKHGRKAMSFFKYGLNNIANAIFDRKTNDYNNCVKLLSCT
ncbi:MAG: hypothetical protein A2W91_04940 [Bacteroidetes bacterium GWF2_38_335]|nr:MAG: hypothetical protein A2W91_04940 [Bacteroidetes bacterium GWF2_38_335]OFY79823.1 MAG: hypothetical protein A2281_10480 [Bacteroidetes bacterium RIFOXYA12_FULL_38_20]